LNIYKNWLFLPIGLLLYQIFILAHYGFGSNDYGYLFGMGWRILNGQEIYTDFLYARPPLSPYLTAFWIYILPEDGQFYFARIVNYFYGFTISFLSFIVLRRHFSSFFTTANQGLLLALIIIFNVNFISHFWHTTDGLLMASFALFFGLQKQTPSTKLIFASAFFVFLSMMAKQSFYPLPFVFSFIYLMIYGKKSTFVFIVSLIFILITFVSYTYIFNENQLLAYLNFKQYESQLGPFFEAAVVYYVLGWVRLFPFISVIILIVHFKYLYKYFAKRRYKKVYIRFMLFFARGYIFLYSLLLLVYTQNKLETGESIIIFHTPLLGGLLVAVIWLLIEIQQKIVKNQNAKPFLVLLFMMSLAWMSSLSWGYKTPALYSGVIIFFFIYIEWYYTRKHMDYRYLLGVFVSYFIAISVMHLHSLDSSSFHLGKYSKKMNGLYERNELVIEKLEYINSRVQSCKDSNSTYTVLPADPYVHYIYNDYPTLSLDWVSNVEMLNQKQRLKEEISHVQCVVVDKYYPFWNDDRFGFDTIELLGHSVLKIDLATGKEQEKN